jgi:guanylate kinase
MGLPMAKGPLFILSGPSGSGKTTVIERLLADTSLPLRLSVSVTTRPPRAGEKDGVHYHFWTRERFERELAADGFLEWAAVYGKDLYGTLTAEVEPFRLQGRGVLLEIDVKGWEQVKRRCPEAVAIFLRTSSLETYETRLRERRTEGEVAIQKRLQAARDELARAPEYDYQVINDDLEAAVARLRSIIVNHLSGKNE